MNYDFFTIDKIKTYKLINGVIIHSLKLNRDKRGVLVETLKKDWYDVYGEKLPFVQNYFSTTKAGVARDEDRWHYHPTKQVDRFVVISGNIIVALYDWRKQSKTFGLLNLFKMGQGNGDSGQYLLMIPKNVLHCFLAVGKTDATILNYPTTLYDPKEEGRALFNQTKFVDDSYFSWDLIKDLLIKKGVLW